MRVTSMTRRACIIELAWGSIDSFKLSDNVKGSDPYGKCIWTFPPISRELFLIRRIIVAEPSPAQGNWGTNVRISHTGMFLYPYFITPALWNKPTLWQGCVAWHV